MTNTAITPVTYTADNQQLTITEQDVRTYLGGADAEPKEIKMFLELCKARQLNPFIREAYFVKYGKNPATIVVGKEVFTKRAARNPKFQGFKAGTILTSKDGALVRREGSLTLPGENVIGGWAEVFVDGYQVPVKEEVSFTEYAGRKSDGKLNNQWATKPATMIRKVALVHALREAFPEELGSLYDEAEMIAAENVQTPTATQEPMTPPQATQERPARLNRLRALMKEAKEVGIVISDEADPSRGLMGWIYTHFHKEPDELTDTELAEAETYVRERIEERKDMLFIDDDQMANEDIVF